MLDILKGQLSLLERDLSTLHQEEANILALAKKAILHIRVSCKELTLKKLSYEFQNRNEEISFFKELKSVFYSKLFYYTDIYTIESQKPNGGDKIKRKYYKEHLYRISEHFNTHRFLYQYYRTGQTEWDERYFLLINKFDEKYDLNGIIVPCEDDYSSSHDMLYAKIISNDRLENFLTEQLDKLNGIKPREEQKDRDIATINRMVRKIKWTDSKAAMIEFVYALVCSKCINNGDVDIKEVMEFVEHIFGIDTGDFYRTYVELRQRNNRTKFLDRLKASLLAKMDEDDEKDFIDPLAKRK